jgi:3-dehydroquinate synthase
MVDMSASKELRIKSNIRDYSVLFVDDFSPMLQKEIDAHSFFIVDKNVFRLYQDKLQDVIKQKHMVVEATEPNKSLDYTKTVIKTLIGNNIKKNNRIVAIGGGIIQDITGFVSSILFRGVEWVFYPTTLLAQSDSCIGAKTSINVDDFKNQLGTFYPPASIVLDVNFLKTLTPTDIKSGLGEIIKVHLLDSEKSLSYIESHFVSDLNNPAQMNDLIHRSLLIKKGIIEKDEYDRDYRNILNYGHTFGHALESVTNYKVCHGQAVTLGMDMANYISWKQGMLSEKNYQRMQTMLLRNYPEFIFEKTSIDPFLKALTKDKKNIGGNLTAILTEGPGKMKKVQMPFDEHLKHIIQDFIETSNIRITKET